MIARYSQIQQQVTALARELKNVGHIQKIYSTSRYLCMQVRFPGKNICLYIGRGHGHEGIWLGNELPSSFLRLRDRWLEWCRKNFTSALLIGIKMDEQDRGIELQLQRGGEKQSFYLMWLGRVGYFALYEHKTKQWFSSWRGSFEGEAGFEVFDSIGRKKISDTQSVGEAVLVSELLKDEEAQVKKAATPKQKLKSLRTKVKKIEEDLIKIRQWESFSNWIAVTDPEVFNSMEKVVHHDLSYKFPRGLTQWQKRDWLFGQVKRLKSAELLQQQRLAKHQDELNILETKPNTEENPLRPQGPFWKTIAEKVAQTTQVEADYVIHNFADYKIGVGKSARGNDQLRKLWGKSEDWWVHSSSGQSAHAIIKLSHSGVPTPEHFSEAAKLIAKQSGFTATQLEVIVTQVKNVRGVTGTPGMVTYKKSKNLLCNVS